jgi:hypothetical protein
MFRRRLKYQADNFSVFGVIAMYVRRRFKKWWDFERGVVYRNVHDVDSLDLGNLPGQQIARIAPRDNLWLGNHRSSLL